MRVRIEVTARDIANGRQSDACACPIAKAARRRGLRDVAVYHGVMWCTGAESIDLPEIAEDFRHNFDYKGPKAVKPFSFTVNVPAKAVRR